MSIIVTCSCGKQFKARSEFIGRRATCPKCGAALMIGPPPPPAPDPVATTGSTPDRMKVREESNQLDLTDPPMSPAMKKATIIGGMVLALMLIASVTTAIVMLNSDEVDAHLPPKATSRADNASSHSDRIDHSGQHSVKEQNSGLSEKNQLLPPNVNKVGWRAVLEGPLTYDLRPKVAFRQLVNILEMWVSMPKDHFFRIIAKVGPGSYEAVITNSTGNTATGNLILRTSFTDFESIGRTRLTVTFEGTIPMRLANGFTKEVSVYQEAVSDRDGRSMTTKEAQELYELGFAKIHAARQIVVVAMMLDGYEHSDQLNAATEKALSEYLGEPPEGIERIFVRPRSIGQDVQKLLDEGYTALSYSLTTGDAKLSDAVRRHAH